MSFVVGGLVVGGSDEPSRGRSAPAAVPQKPEGGPTTFGEYVPPKDGPEPAEMVPSPTPTPRPTVKVTPTERRRAPERERSQRRRECPPTWKDVPFLRMWCERHGYRVR
ncbi:hypothetical protein GCM10009678_37870 [Actinomadura kijaniata]